MEKSKAAYRNALRSKQLIRDAFLLLMQEKDVSKIKAKEVFELAGVSKGTFYVHYSSIFEIFEDIESDYLSRLFRVFEERELPITCKDILPQFISGLAEIEKDRKVFIMLFRMSSSDSFFNKVKHRFLDYMLTSYMRENPNNIEERAHGFFLFVAGGALTLICEWLECSDESVSSLDCAKFLDDCLENGIEALQDRTVV